MICHCTTGQDGEETIQVFMYKEKDVDILKKQMINGRDTGKMVF